MGKITTINTPKRGEVYLVDFDPAVGSEVQKIRPAVVIQNDISNEYSPLIIVAAFTSKFRNILYPTEVLIDAPEGGIDKPSVIQLNQIRTVDKRRLHKRIGVLKSETMAQVNRALEISLGLIDF